MSRLRADGEGELAVDSVHNELAPHLTTAAQLVEGQGDTLGWQVPSHGVLSFLREGRGLCAVGVGCAQG